MDQHNFSFCMLDAMPCPAFLAQDGILIHANPAAESYAPPMGTSVDSILLTGKQEYHEFEDGCLDLTVSLNDRSVHATVTRLEQYTLILPQEEQTELQALALAAQSLRSPLSNAMISIDQLLATDDTVAGSQWELGNLNRSLYQMLRIVNNMSDAFSYQQPQLPRMEIRDIGSVLDELMTKNKEVIGHTGITLQYTGPEDPVYGLIDSQMLERAVENLLSNAIKYTPKGGSIDARLTRNGAMLYLTVQDSGCGIDPAVRQALFSRYLRQPNLEDSRNGIGLGLVLVRSVAALHGGTVLMQTNGENGTRFTMTIAIRQKSSAMHSPVFHVDYAGERDHTLVELSETLPASLYHHEP